MLKESAVHKKVFKGLALRMLVVGLCLFVSLVFWQSLVWGSGSSLLPMSLLLVLSLVGLLSWGFFNIYGFVDACVLKPLNETARVCRESKFTEEHFPDVRMPDAAAEEFADILEHRRKFIALFKQRNFEGPMADDFEQNKPSQKPYEQLTDGVVQALEKANAYNDEDTGAHMLRICLYCQILAEHLQMDDSFIRDIRRYASLHDVGKIGIPDEILKKPGRLDSEQWAVMQSHARIGHDILKSVGMNELAQNIALYHHERWDGTGYPLGLKGEEIPIEARIAAIADVFDALVSERSYKPAFERSRVEKLMSQEIGCHFDPKLGQLAFEHLDEFYAVYEQHC